MVITGDHARLIFDDSITDNVQFTIETAYGLVSGYWTPDQFGCVGWELDSNTHLLIITYGECEQRFIIPHENI